jgi:hypothetical protein
MGTPTLHHQPSSSSPLSSNLLKSYHLLITQEEVRPRTVALLTRPDETVADPSK